MSDEKLDAEARVSTVAELENSPAGIVKRWKAELALADEDEKNYRKEGHEVYKLYDGAEAKNNSFNIVWSNTETLRPSVYNSTPEPDVRRRFRDPDPIGKVASTVLERALSYTVDTDEFDDTIQDAVLDALLPGRGITRIKYEPTLVTQTDEQGNPVVNDAGEEQQELVDEKTIVEHVQWDDFRRGPGKRWKDVRWVAFRHDMSKDDLVDHFGDEIADKVPLNDSDVTDESLDKEVKQVFRTAEIWEIWDKDKREVLFICKSYAEQPLLIEADPLSLMGFFPLPRPIYAIEKSTSLVPVPVYRLYKQQAKELDKVSGRINRVIDALKVRGAYSSVAPEAESILSAADNEMTPIKNVAEVAAMGGLDKAIWIMPVDKLITVLNGLYQARAEIKATIYEITGISDIIRGATNASETATAQSLKSQWGSLRLQKLQKEVQRFVRDLMRLMADVIATRFQPETLASITQIQLPTGQQKQQAIQMLQRLQKVPAGPNGEMPQPPQQLVEVAQQASWDEVMAVIRNDAQRTYKIDVETDSTVAETIDRDMQGLQEVVTSIGALIGGSIPAIQSGMLPIEAVKSIALAIARRARLGSAVEDALDDIQMPQPQGPDPAQVQQQEADRQGQMQEIVQQLMDAIEKPRRIVAQADQTGRIDGTLENAA